MLKKIWLHTVRGYINLGLFFYYKKINAFNLENIAKNTPVLILSNHQNALLDALIIAVKCKRFPYFLTRASAFKSTFFAGILSSLRMLPVYRMRDGIRTIKKNEAVFKTCSQLLFNNEVVVIFPEGNHHLNRTVRPLSKGFTRVVFDTLATYPNLELQLVPVGFNYKNPERFVDEVGLYVGTPIDAKDYQVFEKNVAISKLKETVHESICKLTTHIDNNNYEELLHKLETLHVDFLNPESVNTCILNNFQDCNVQETQKFSQIKGFFKSLLFLNLWLPFIIWKRVIRPKIKEVEFVSTFRFVVAITLVPVYLLLMTVFLTAYFGLFSAILYMFAVIILALIVVKW